ncbi:MAG: CoA transferase, partial [Rhodospirillales bacterium]|nr:CoA transferase [Rhodospirillales bacterium]
MTAGSALAGLRVLDISRVLAGPSCGQLLADMGADVIKVEPPDGDENRRWPPFVASGASCNFDSVNRGKRNLAVDLKHPNGQRIVHGLADRADVLLLSFLPQTAAKLGLDPAVLTARNPRLVVCEVTGYGAAGPMAERPGYDLMMQAFAGAMYGLVLTDDLIVLVMFWEITSILSYLLIGFYHARGASRRAALQALLVTTLGGLVMFVGAVILVVQAGTASLSA